MRSRGRGDLERGEAQCYQVESTRHKRNQYSNCGNIHDTGSFIVWDKCSTCARSEGTTKGTRMEHGRLGVHDTGVTIRKGVHLAKTSPHRDRGWETDYPRVRSGSWNLGIAKHTANGVYPCSGLVSK